MTKVDSRKAKAQASRRLALVENGEARIVASPGEISAGLAPCRASARRRELGLFAGEATTHDDFDELPADIAAAFGTK
jgi:antitoxin (DNA-binding transcriptional repressor) of toxin-antitoxin stability system